MSKKPKRPRDTNQLAKFMTDVASGNTELPELMDDGKNPAAVKRGQLGGIKGGRTRADRLTPEQKAEAARLAARARWRRKTD